MLAELPLIMLLLNVAALTACSTWMPPATAAEPLLAATLFGSDAARLALLSVTVLLVIVTVPPATWMAPVSAKRPFGALALASLPLIVELVIVSGPSVVDDRAAVCVTCDARQSRRRTDAVVADRRVRERDRPPAVDPAAIR